MSAHSTSSRRSFLKGGAIAAAPLAVALPVAALAAEDHRARAQRLQDEAEIRNLHQAWLRKLATGQDASMLFADPRAARLDPAVQGLAADHSGEADWIDVAADGLSATGRFAVTADLQTELPKTTTLGQMAHMQGGGLVRSAERRTLHAGYAKRDGSWAIETLALRSA
ncbi:MAG TPA: hypothetical protein VHX64_04115 [Caulobacteraceae bacterium]|jgi:hypothetical protein|nr:hypothetical protein [Caulobacteraceae bacterium]